MKLKAFWYKHNTKVISYLIQGLLAGLLVLCVIGIPRAVDWELSLTDVAGGFESTEPFFQTVEDTIRDKISAEQNRELFEQGGSFNDQRQIDIRQYISGILDEANYNLNLTYHLSDLIIFAKDSASDLEEYIYELAEDGMSEEEIGSELLRGIQRFETVLPLSGTSLADTAKMSTNPGLTMMEYGRSLCEASLDIEERYEEYSMSEDPETRSDAPSNILYYVENTSSRKHYSNMAANSAAAAVSFAAGQENMTFLFEGERRFNIMVANTEHVLNDKTSEWFMQTSFLGSGEQVVIAVDTQYPIGDELRSTWLRYQKREPVLIFGISAALLCLVSVLVLLIISVMVNGKDFPGNKVNLLAFDQVPTEIAAGFCLIGIIGWFMLGRRWLNSQSLSPRRELAGYCVLVAVEYELCLLSLMSLLRRIYGGNLWTNSVSYYVLLGTRQVYEARKSAQRLMLLYLGFIVLNMVSLAVGGWAGFIMAIVLNMAALLYLMRNVAGSQNIREGLMQISKGKLDYRINTDALYGESREMGQAVNEMGDGLQKAVDSMIQGERLKAELITNLSHDLKTPLTSIINYVDLLKRRNLEDQQAREYLEVLDAKTQRLRQLTEDLVEVSKISSGNIELHPQELELREFIRQACGEYEDRLEEKKLKMVFDLGDRPAMLYVDGASLWRIVENLLGNIAKYAREDTRVYVTLTQADGQASVSFQNESAVEITASAASLKERFGRGDESRRTEGFGLGLSIADSLTSLMGGTFDVIVDRRQFEAVMTFPLKS